MLDASALRVGLCINCIPRNLCNPMAFVKAKRTSFWEHLSISSFFPTSFKNIVTISSPRSRWNKERHHCTFHGLKMLFSPPNYCISHSSKLGLSKTSSNIISFLPLPDRLRISSWSPQLFNASFKTSPEGWGSHHAF